MAIRVNQGVSDWNYEGGLSVAIQPQQAATGEWNYLGGQSVTIQPQKDQLPQGWNSLDKLTLRIEPLKEINWLLIGGAVFAASFGVVLLTQFRK